MENLLFLKMLMRNIFVVYWTGKQSIIDITMRLTVPAT